ncbi:MAG: hypothetical protein ACLFQV_03670 [Vulcanimicrobiota bacterium]
MGLQKFKCKKCKSDLNVTETVELFSCAFCGANYKIMQDNGKKLILLSEEKKKGNIKQIDNDEEWKKT